MANYYESARTNYFNVKDEAAFEKFLLNFGEGIRLVSNQPPGGHAIIFDDEVGVPSYYYDKNGNEVEIDFVEEVSKHLTEDSILVLIGIGREKMRYLTGYAVAINSEGKQVSINLNSIYTLAKQAFGVNEVGPAEY